jgi:nitroreductase
VLGTLSLGGVMENMWLMAHTLKLGFQIMSVFGGPVQKDIRKFLNIPDHMAISYAVRLGYPTTQSKYVRVRRDCESFTYRNAYGKKYEHG